MGRKLEVVLEKRGVRCVAELLEQEAPRTCEVVWQALPQGGQAYHAKYASNEVYTLVPPFADPEPGLENSTITPIPRDILYFYFPPGQVGIPDVADFASTSGVIDLAIFYGRNNFLFSPATGPVPGNVFATITENFEAMAQACDNIWREGFVGERLVYRRLE
jgi:hypothetical protein